MTIKFANHKNETERQIIVLLVEDILAAGFQIRVNDGEETVTPFLSSEDEGKIFAAMSSTDEDILIVKRPDEPESQGWIRLVYGNGGDVLSDNTCNLEDNFPAIFVRANELAERFG